MQYRIKAVRKGVKCYYRALTKGDNPVFTPAKDQANLFENMDVCKGIRDVCLQYVTKADIEIVR